MLSPSWCGLWSRLHMQTCSTERHVRPNLPPLPPPVFTLMSDQLNPVEQHKAAQSDMVVRKCFPSCCCSVSAHCFSPCTLCYGDVQLDWFAVDVMGMVLRVPSFHCDTDTADFYSKWEPTEGIRNPVALKPWPFPSQAVCFTPSFVFCCFRQGWAVFVCP